MKAGLLHVAKKHGQLMAIPSMAAFVHSPLQAHNTSSKAAADVIEAVALAEGQTVELRLLSGCSLMGRLAAVGRLAPTMIARSCHSSSLDGE